MAASDAILVRLVDWLMSAAAAAAVLAVPARQPLDAIWRGLYPLKDETPRLCRVRYWVMVEDRAGDGGAYKYCRHPLARSDIFRVRVDGT